MSLKKFLNKQNLVEFANARKQYLINCGCKEEVEILDAITPSFLGLMESMPLISREIVHYLVMTKKNLSEFVTTNFLSKKMREPSKIISIYCKSLYDVGMVERQKVSKGYEYKITSQLFLDWYLMRYDIKKNY